MKQYTAVVEKCPETGLFVGYVPGFPGAHSQGKTRDELNKNLEEVIAMLLADRTRQKEGSALLTALLRSISIVIAFAALMEAFFAYMYRFESTHEYEWALRMDFVLGFLFAVAFFLWRIPGSAAATFTRHVVTVCGIVVIWGAVSGSLFLHHHWQYHIRSTPSERNNEMP